MKCKDCEHYVTRVFGSGARKSYDGHECELTGKRVSAESIFTDCPVNRKVDPDAEFVRID